jgi:hypothetical protein
MSMVRGPLRLKALACRYSYGCPTFGTFVTSASSSSRMDLTTEIASPMGAVTIGRMPISIWCGSYTKVARSGTREQGAVVVTMSGSWSA